MTIVDFIKEFEKKNFTADPNLPKYVDLVLAQKEKVEKGIERSIIEEARIETQTTPDQILWTNNNANLNGGTNPYHNQVLSQDYTSVREFLDSDGDIKEFNRRIIDYLIKESGSVGKIGFSGSRPGSGRLVSNGFNFFDGEPYFDEQGLTDEEWEKIKPTWFQKLGMLFSKSYSKKVAQTLAFQTSFKMMNDKREVPARMKKFKAEVNLTVEDFFNQVKAKIAGKDKVLDRLKPIYEQIIQAQEMGQEAMLEDLTEKLLVEIYECSMSESGFDRAISLQDLKLLQNNCPKLLDISLVKNFTRAIPSEVVKKKKEADQLHIFDNYVILSFDPSGKFYKETQSDTATRKSKDPILFGIIFGSEKLYYIADWVDEYCDLTWDMMLDIMAKKDEDFKI